MGKQWKQCQTFILGGSKITVDGDCSQNIKRRLLLGRKVMTNLDSIFKSRDITLPTKVRLVKAMVFPVVMYGCESWTVKKAEHAAPPLPNEIRAQLLINEEWFELEPGLESRKYICHLAAPFNFMATVTICSDFGAQKNKV